MLSSFVKKFPAVVTVIPLVTGILISYYSGLNLSVLPDVFFIIIWIVPAILAVYLYKTISKGKLFLFSYLALLVFYGIFSFQFSYFKTNEDNIAAIVKDFKNKNTVLKGIIIEQPEVKEDKIRILLKAEQIDNNVCSGFVLATVYKNKFKEIIGSSYQYGDEIEITGRLEELPHQRNPGEFDYGEYLKLHNVNAIFTSFGYSKINITGHIEQNFFKTKIIYPVKDYSIYIIDKLVGGDEGEYLKGLVLGERSNISREIKENFVNAGVAHIIAVSGLNVAYVIIIIWGFLTFIPVKHSYKIVFTVLVLVFYMNLTGNVPSIVRATIMAGIFLLAQVIERKPNSYNIVSFSGLVILLVDPRQLFDAGFILSFTAIFSLIIIYPVLDKWINSSAWYSRLSTGKYAGKAARIIIALFIGTFAAQIGTLPVTAIMFKKISIISLVANLFAIPLSNISLGLGFIVIILSTFSIWLASVFADLNSFLIFIQLWVIAFCAKLDFSFVETYFVDWMLLAFYYLILVLILTLNHKNYKVRLAVIILIISNFIVWKSVMDKTIKAQITYIDVGNSNSTLIKMPQGTSVLINTGSSTVKYTSAERNVIPYLKTQGISEVDLLIITSLNYNEFRNLKLFIEKFPVRKTVIPAYYKPVFENKYISTSFEKSNIEFIESSKVINKQGKFRIYLYYDSLYRSESMMAQFVYGSQNFLFDDAYSLDENLINTALLPSDLNIQVLKTAGAGSFDYVSAEFLAKAGPEFVIISSSRSTRKKLNTDIFTESLEHIGINVLKTNENGAVIFKTDGAVIERVKW